MKSYRLHEKRPELFVAVIPAWMHSNKRIDDLRSEMHSQNDSLRSELKEVIRSESALLRAEMRRVEEVMDARLRHLEQAE